MKVLLLGAGAREHALGWKLAQSPRLTHLLSAPGNPGLAQIGAVVPDVDPTDPEAVVALAVANRVDLVVVGPEAPLAAGVIDALEEAGIGAFGPTRAGAQLESSKAFAKDMMERAGVPTAAAATFKKAKKAERYLNESEPPYVVKADGLAAGKGVLVTEDLEAATAWARLCLDGGFGEAGRTVVIEEYLSGREVSVFAVCDGTRAVPLVPARDYKRLLDGDQGPNTGGMGCYSPVEDLPPDLVPWTMETVITPVLTTLAAAGIPYSGFLYAGLILTESGPKVLEFNCRLGDPETQVVLPRLDDDLLELLAGAAAGRLTDRPLTWSPHHAVNVVLASQGYPESPERGKEITGLDEVDDLGILAFHAGTRATTEGIVTAGGRVLNIVGLGDSRATARARAYLASARLDFAGKRFRTDIAE